MLGHILLMNTSVKKYQLALSVGMFFYYPDFPFQFATGMSQGGSNGTIFIHGEFTCPFGFIMLDFAVQLENDFNIFP
jgi:hypothetical protein